MFKRLILQLGIGLLIGLLIVAGYAWLARSYTYQGSLIDPPVPAADFSLPAGEGTIFTLAEQRGKVVLLFFGYTHCPDVCPTTLYDFQKIKARLGERADDVRFVFITVDPERDSVDALHQYVTTFDPEFIALSGDFAQLEAVWQAYGVFRQKQEVGDAGGYTMDHTARIYVVDAQGNLRLTFPFGMAAEAMADDLIHLLRE